MGAVVLDTRALELVVNPRADTRAAFLVRSLLRAAEEEETPVLVPTAVLTEAYRGGPEDAEIELALGQGIKPITLGKKMARHAGRLKYRDKLNSCHTVDAAVVATVIRLGGGLIITGDPDDLRALARDHGNIKVHGLS